MAEPFLGELRLMSFDYPPRGWAKCDGQLLAIAQNQALFSLLGTYFGGDGRTNFALPDLRGRVPMHNGPQTPQGARGGQERVTLSLSQLAVHSHGNLQGTADAANANVAGGALAASKTRGGINRYGNGAPDGQLIPSSISTVGAGSGHNNLQPSLALNYCIALQGIFPSRL